MPNERLDQAVKNCRAYRKYLKAQGVPQHLATKGFLITSDMIKKLLAQNGGVIDGIRIYVGMDETGDKTIKPYAVACVKNGEKYNDWKVPNGRGTQSMDAPVATATTAGDATNTTLTSLSTTDPATEPLVEEPRPCPHECGDENDLNTDV